ncbi:MAG TPA: hypothetical protein VLW55_25270 [Burkholderiaceae bacterium]|nr:hypothetical protein [Burkholderiaceae bacterium]
MRFRQLVVITLISAAANSLVACGSGDKAGAAPPPPQVAPQISLGPGGRAAAVGATVSFDVSATASPTRYQWRRNGVDIPGATMPAYSLAVGLADDGALFSVIVGNSVGEVTSGDALLTVYPVPPLVSTCQTPTDPSFTILPSNPAKTGVQAGTAVGGCKGPLRSVQWTQTAGPTVALLSDKTPAISFLPPTAATYSFRADIVDVNGTGSSATVDIPVVANTDSTSIAIRDDQAVRQSGNISLRSWPTLAPGDSVVSVTWKQTLGPPAVLDTSDPLRALFTAPMVARDSVLAFTATLQTAQGNIATDEAVVLVESTAQAPNADQYAFAGDHVSRVYAYKPAGQYASALQQCVYDPQLQWTGAGKNTCSLAVLPFLAQDTGGAEPSVAQIMDRVVVSHDWVGAVFEQFIARSDMADVRRLLNGVTAVVIGAHVRPSFYFVLTGAIYLDADNFWLTPEQRDLIDETPDFRSGFDRDLEYSGVWRYALNGNNIFQYFPPTSRLNRTLDYLVFESAWLLYHELGHAGDFLPPAVRGSLDPSSSAWDNIGPRYGAAQLPSDVIAQQLPLTSVILRGLAQVKFFGAQADAAQRAYTPTQVGSSFSGDRASDEYSYSTTREDIAMLFEEFMMFHRHGIRRDIAFTDKIMPTTTGDTLSVRWGQRGRDGAVAVEPRVKIAVQNIAPWIDPALVDALPPPLDMRAGESWNANLSLPAPLGTVEARRSTAATRAADAWLLDRALRRPGDRTRYRR